MPLGEIVRIEVMATRFFLFYFFFSSCTLSHIELGKKEEGVFIPLSFLVLAELVKGMF